MIGLKYKTDIEILAAQGWWLTKMAKFLSINPAMLHGHLKALGIKCQHAPYKNPWNGPLLKYRNKKQCHPCECGCGEMASPGKRFVRYHVARIHRKSPKPCECGCGRMVKSWRRFIPGHQCIKSRPVCECGCGHLVSKPNRRFIKGHGKEIYMPRGEANHNWKGGRINIQCSECGKLIPRWPFEIERRKHFFCSAECDSIWKIKNASGPNHSCWQGGLSFQEYCSEWQDKQYKADIKKRDGDHCQLCDTTESLCVHHIDYDKKNCRPENLITLCRRCNFKVNYNRESWTNHFQNGRQIAIAN